MGEFRLLSRKNWYEPKWKQIIYYYSLVDYDFGL